ncbi:MAG: hypothetical protein R6V03_00230 [Kiritimatiellia bacterium]
MKTHNPHAMRHDRSVLDVSTVVIAFIWTGIWFLWPSAADTSVKPERSRNISLNYVNLGQNSSSMDPIVLLRDEMHIGQIDESLPGSLCILPSRTGYYLERRARKRTARAGPKHVEPTSDGAKRRYSPLWKDTPAFDLTDRGKAELHFEVSDNLKKFEFQIGPTAANLTNSASLTWTVEVLAHFDDAGKPEYTAIVAGSDDRELDTAAARAVFTGRLKKPDGECSGYIRINYGYR